MFGFVRGIVWGAVLIAAGWVGGSIYPAPSTITAPIAARAPNLAARLGVSNVTFERLSAMMSEEQALRFRHDAAAIAARAGEAIIVESDDKAELAETLAALPDAEQNTPRLVSSASFEEALYVCPGMTVSNAPAADAARRVRTYASIVDVQGVRVAVNPTQGACLSSAFGPRGRGNHKGLDFHAAAGGPILAAAAGTVLERRYRDDYGNMLLIDHGGGVYTRYAHLSSFADGVVEGATVTAGQRLGLMGNTASYQIPIHLHYEVLLGDYNNPRGSFGLTPHSPFEFRAPT
ncbi:peptidase M23B [alpha proteobacterium U9-1i]|nr:peptidase M23B [alpha proteobacterium U9-1i]